MSITSSGIKKSTTTSSTPSTSPRTSSSVLIRPATLKDAMQIGVNSARTYTNTPMTQFLHPYRAQHPNSYLQGCQLRAIRRMLDPRNLTFVAIEADNPTVPIAHALFIRLGNDSGAKKQINSRASLRLTILRCLFWVVVKLWLVLGLSKCDDPANLAIFNRESDLESARHFSSHPKRLNRWHAQSVVVTPEFQRRGIGKQMITEVLKRAEEENVPVGLEASEEGEFLYRSMGFKLLGRFKLVLQPEEDEKGGVMMWNPEGWSEE